MQDQDFFGGDSLRAGSMEAQSKLGAVRQVRAPQFEVPARGRPGNNVRPHGESFTNLSDFKLESPMKTDVSPLVPAKTASLNYKQIRRQVTKTLNAMSSRRGGDGEQINENYIQSLQRNMTLKLRGVTAQNEDDGSDSDLNMSVANDRELLALEAEKQ